MACLRVFRSAALAIAFLAVWPACDSAEETACDANEPLLVNYRSTWCPPMLYAACVDRIIVKFAPDVSADARQEIVEQTGCYLLCSCEPGGVVLVQIPPAETVERMVALFESYDQVEYAERNCLMRATFVPDDSYFAFQWNLDNGATGGIQMEAAWDLQQGDPNVIVAILDTGIAYEDFGVYRQAPDLAGTNFVPGYDFVHGDSHPNDDQGHGTHVCGTIAQSTNNGIGVAGVAFGCSIMPVKILAADGIGDHFAIAQGIYFAIENGATVINLSLGGPEDSATLRTAMAEAYRQGVTVICAVGNEFDEGSPTAFPAAYDDYCLAVGAVRFDLSRAPYSNVGVHIDVVAPGGDLAVDQNDDGYLDGILQQTFVGDPSDFAYWFFQGTSMATPHVAGLMALLASRGISDPDVIRAAIESTARDLGPAGWDSEYGWGLIDAAAALAFVSE